MISIRSSQHVHSKPIGLMRIQDLEAAPEFNNFDEFPPHETAVSRLFENQEALNYAQPSQVPINPYRINRRGSLVLAAVALSELGEETPHSPQAEQAPEFPLYPPHDPSAQFAYSTANYAAFPDYPNYSAPQDFDWNAMFPSYVPHQEEYQAAPTAYVNETYSEFMDDPSYEEADPGYDSPDANEYDPEFEAPTRTRSAKTSTAKPRGRTNTAAAAKRSRKRSPSFEGSDSKSQAKKRKRHCERWTEDEKQRLVEAVKMFGMSRWKEIAQFVRTKDSDQCNQHWYRVLNPKINREPWTHEEDCVLEENVRVFGESSWKKVSECLPGRTDTQCRHRWIVLSRSGKTKTKGKFSR